LGFVLAIAAAGCGSPVGRVSGQVKLKGQPLKSGTVTFLGQDGYRASCAIAQDTTYTFDNVPVGPINIAVCPRVPAGLRKYEEPDPEGVEIPVTYGNPEKSGLRYRVKPGSQNFDIILTAN
jgi:hypothetical protein